MCYCRIIRKTYPEGWRYFLQLVLEGPPPVKVKPETGELLHAMGKGCVGLDIGPQTLAFSANKDVGLEELAEGVQLAQDEIRRIKRSMDRSRKNSNPKMFTADGQIVRKNIDEMEKAIVSLIEDDSLRMRLGKRARDDARMYHTWDMHVDRIIVQLRKMDLLK